MESIRAKENVPKDSRPKPSAEQLRGLDHLCSAHIDTVVLLLRLPGGAQFTAIDYETEIRREQGTKYKREWPVIDCYPQGWRVAIQPDLHWLEIRLVPSRVCRTRPIHNYPLIHFDARDLWAAERAILSVVRLPEGMNTINWAGLGVREVAYTCDIPVDDKAGVLTAMATARRAGKKIDRGSSIQWKSGAKTVQVYDKLEQCKSRLSKGSFQMLSAQHPELESVVRFEVTLRPVELRRLFGLPSPRLPTLQLVNQPWAMRHALREELESRLKIESIGRVSKQGASDRTVTFFNDISAAAMMGEGVPLPFARGAKLCVVYFFSELYKGKELRERLGLSASSVGKFAAELRQLGFPPRLTIDSYQRRCLVQFLVGLRQATDGAELPDLTASERLASSVSPPWSDGSKQVESTGMAVEDCEDDDYSNLLSLTSM